MTGNKSKIWLMFGGIATFAIIVFGWMFAISPLMANYNNVQTELTSNQARNEIAQVKLTHIQSIKDTIPLKTQFDTLALSIPSDVNDTGFFANIQQIQNETDNVIIDSITIDPSATRVVGTTTEYPVVIAGTGTPDSTNRFIQGLQNSDRLFVVKSVNITGTDADYSFQITASIYKMTNPVKTK